MTLTNTPEIMIDRTPIDDFTSHMGSFINNNIILKRDTAQGGTADEILGPQGSGKTSLMISYATRIMDLYPDEIIIWRDSYESPCMFNRINNYDIFAEEGVNLQFRNILKNKIIDFEVTTFKDLPDLKRKLNPGRLEVVYTNETVIGYIKLINYFRRQGGWNSIFIDEYEDIAPINESGFKYKLIGAFGKNLKNVRKGLVSLFCNTQDKLSIDWRVRPKFMCYTYLSGALVDQTSEVYQKAVNGLPVGTAYISWYGKFGLITFPPFKPKDPVVEAIDLNKQDELEKLLNENKQ